MSTVVSFPSGQETPPSVASDASLVMACAAGDKSALGTLFERYHTDIFRFAARIAGNEAVDIDDVVQNTFIQASHSAARFRGGSPVKSWLFGITVNLMRRRKRTLWRRRAKMRRYAERQSEQPPRLTEPESVASARQQMARLKHAIEALPARLRVVFVLCDLEETSGVEAAAALNMPQGTLYRRLYEARRALRAALQE